MYGFDGLNRVTKTIEDPSGLALAMTVWYDALGRQTLTEDPAGQKTARLYDGLGRLTRLTEDYSGLDRYTDYAYDRAGRLTRQTGYTNGTSGAENTDYAYNKAGVKTVVTYPDSGTVSFGLDSVSRVTSQTDPRNVTLAFDYDPMGRLLTKHEGANVYWTYGYNALGALTLARKGTSAGGDQVARTEWIYDGLARLTLENQTIRDAASKYLRYKHDKAGNVTHIQYPSTVVFGYTRTNLGQIDTVYRTDDPTPTNFASYTYVGDRVKRFRYLPNGELTAERSYDGAARLTRLTWSMTGKTYPDFSYAYDQAGNILTKTHNHRASNKTEVYDIDGLDRLADARYDFRSVTHNFDYDDLGNWLTYTENTTAQTRLHNAVNEITKIGTTELLYDGAGNLTKDNAGGNGPYHTFYDAEKRLTRIERDDSTAVASYEYDALGRRIEFIDAVGSVTKRYYHDGDQVVQEYDASATPVLQRTYLWGNTIDELLYMKDDPNNYNFWVLHNHLYSPEVLLNGSYEIVERYDYDAYGHPVIYTGNGGDGDWWDGDETTSDTSAKGLAYLFTGRELDNLDAGALKLYYYRARTYSPTLGRFLQRDPIRYIDGMNLYEYANSIPTMKRDPSGKLVGIVIGGCVVVGGAALYAWVDWGTDSLPANQEKELQRLITKLRDAARQKGDDQVLTYLDKLNITGIFEKGKMEDDSRSETRNGRYFGLERNRTILSADFFERNDEGSQLETLLHESYHAATEDWSEDISYKYADKKNKNLFECPKSGK